jgi:hemolysin III
MSPSPAESVFSQSPAEERANAASHGIAALLALVALPATAAEAATLRHPLQQAGLAVFFTTMVLMYLVSTAYHLLPVGSTKRLLQRWDHALIFVFIAGSFTPFALLGLQRGGGPGPLVAVWALALVGMGLKLAGRLRRPGPSTALYLAFAWMAVWVARPVLAMLSADGLALLVAGGMAYMLGCAFYLLDRRLRYSHLVWHLFVVAGSLCHVMAVHHAPH